MSTPIICILIKITTGAEACKIMGAYNCLQTRANTTYTMFKNVDLYLGVFLILCGFGVSLLNLRSTVLRRNKFSSILLSENVLLICIGIAFLCRAVYSLNPVNLEMGDFELRMAGSTLGESSFQCGFSSLLLSYGPLVMSSVNSFLGLIVDNYLHYKMLQDAKKKDEEDKVQDFGESSRSVEQKIKFGKIYEFWKKYFSILTIALQWIVPILLTLLMYPMAIKEVSIHEIRSLENSCMAMFDLSRSNCFHNTSNIQLDNGTVELRKYITTPGNYLKVIAKEYQKTNSSEEIDDILSNIINIVKKFNNHTDFEYTNLTKSLRQPKLDEKCMKMCFTDNKNMLLYMFVLGLICYFVPITISTVILTKIHIMEVNRPNAKTYVTRELLYNILFWTPVMFDTFLSLVMCSFSMYGLRTSFLNVIANVYQAVKNFMNTRYFNENAIVPS